MLGKTREIVRVVALVCAGAGTITVESEILTLSQLKICLANHYTIVVILSLNQEICV
jgi:hypothetical protein